MAQQNAPSETEINGFLDKLHAFREGLGEGDKKLLDAMYQAAMGHEEKSQEVKAYWVAAGPRGVAVGGPVGFAAAPWGAAYVNPYGYPPPVIVY